MVTSSIFKLNWNCSLFPSNRQIKSFSVFNFLTLVETLTEFPFTSFLREESSSFCPCSSAKMSLKEEFNQLFDYPP